MKKIIYLILLLLPTVALSCPKNQNLVTRAVDGDTVVIDTGEYIRVLGIDTYDKSSPKMIQKQMTRENLSKETVQARTKFATNVASQMLVDNCVLLEKDHIDKDQDGRLLRYIKVNKMDYGQYMLESGLANVWCGDKKIKLFKKYLKISNSKC